MPFAAWRFWLHRSAALCPVHVMGGRSLAAATPTYSFTTGGFGRVANQAYAHSTTPAKRKARLCFT